jgi:hypothetical protein
MAALVSLPAMAQKGIHVGAQVGENVTGMMDDVRYGDVDYLYKPTLGFTYGVTAGWNFTDYLGLQTEINFAQMGEKIVLRSDRNVENVLNTRYTQIPVMLKFTGGNFSNRFSMMVGPQWSFLNSATMTRNHVDKYQPEGTSDVSNGFAKSNFGMVLCAGEDMNIFHNMYLNIQARFQYGFRQANTSPNILFNQENEDDHLHTMAGGLFAGLHYMFPYK